MSINLQALKYIKDKKSQQIIKKNYGAYFKVEGLGHPNYVAVSSIRGSGVIITLSATHITSLVDETAEPITVKHDNNSSTNGGMPFPGDHGVVLMVYNVRV